jgi:hypothetical protein
LNVSASILAFVGPVTNTQAFLTHHCFGFAFLLSPAFQLLRASIHYTFAILVHQRRDDIYILYTVYTEVYIIIGGGGGGVAGGYKVPCLPTR